MSDNDALRAAEKRLSPMRNRIDEIDAELQRLVGERANVAHEVAAVKRSFGETGNFYRPGREAEILARVAERNIAAGAPLPTEDMTRIIREIMSACLAAESPLSVAYLGPEGTYTNAAAVKHFGHFAQLQPLTNLNEVFREVEAGAAHCGVVPIENSTEGVVNYTLDLVARSPLSICGEIRMRVHHCLLSASEQLSDIGIIYAHAQAIAQCREWLDANLPGIPRAAVSSNAEAARRAASEPHAAAVAGRAAGELYGLNELRSNIEDEPNNTTRFLVVGDQEVPKSGFDMTSLMLAAPNKPGALHRLIEPFARHNVSMTRVESRPSRREAWDYNFFVDIEGHRDDEAVKTAMAEVESHATLFRILGSYPRAVW